MGVVCAELRRRRWAPADTETRSHDTLVVVRPDVLQHTGTSVQVVRMAEIDSGAITEAEFGAGGSPDEGPLEVRARKLSRSVVRKLSRGRPNDDGVSLGGRYDTSHEAAPGRRRFLDGWQALNDGWKNMLHISWDMHSPA